MTSGAGNNFLPKWQVALAIGAPVALGFGYMYYKNGLKSSSKPDPDESNSVKNTKSKSKQISIDGENSTKFSTSSSNKNPLERAQKLKNEGNVLFKASKYDEAIARYNQAIDICPKENSDDLATFYQNRAAAYGMLEKFDAVKADCTKALELKPRYIKALLRRAKALERCNELELALQDATAACMFEGYDNSGSYFLADGILKQLGKQHAEEHMVNKKPSMRSKHFIKTYMMSFYRNPILDLLETSEENISPGLLKIQKAYKNQKYDDIIQLCTEELDAIHSDTSPYEMQILLLRATFYLLLGSLESAHLDFQKIVDSNTVSSDIKVNALIKRASLHIQLEDQEKCFNDFETAVEIDPNYGDIYHHRGQVNLILNKLEDAKADFDKAVQLHPNFAVAYVQKCYTDYRYEVVDKNPSPTEIETSIKRFEDAIKKFPDCPECYTLYAQLLLETSNYSEADTVFAKALEIDPKNGTVYVHRGLLHLQWDGNIDKCLEYINKGLELDDKCQFGYETLGTIEVQRGNLKKAIELFDKALELGQTTMELVHIFSLRDAAKAQLAIRDRLGSNLMNL